MTQKVPLVMSGIDRFTKSLLLTVVLCWTIGIVKIIMVMVVVVVMVMLVVVVEAVMVVVAVVTFNALQRQKKKKAKENESFHFAVKKKAFEIGLKLNDASKKSPQIF